MFFQFFKFHKAGKNLSDALVCATIFILVFGSFNIRAYGQSAETENATSTPLVEENNLSAGNDGTNTTSGEDGADATENESGNTDNGEPAIINTGDSYTDAILDNYSNVNVLNVGSSTPTMSTTTNQNNENQGHLNWKPSQNPLINATSTNTNNATTTNSALVVSETGLNKASSTAGAIINTGNALAVADVFNVSNLNIFNSNGFFYLLSSIFAPLENFDTRALTPEPVNGGCLSSCGSNFANTAIKNTNTVEITNSLVVRADTGANSANGAGSSSITTGNAYAGANVVNIANTNIVNSTYMIMTLNNFGDWGGDFILPNLDFFKQFFTPINSINTGYTVVKNSNTNVSNSNDATVTNVVDSIADSGFNTATSSGSGSEINTGNSIASANVINQVNQNLFGGQQFVAVFRIFGDWTGNVFNAPPGILWRETSNGIELFSDPNYASDEGQEEDGETASTTKRHPTAGNVNLNIENGNSANISNDVQVYALTGDNNINSSNGQAIINTGNAYAGANIVNIANTNVVSRNWILAVINIFGKWNGNISFGQPNLWLGIRADSSGRAEAGSVIRYHYTVINNGDAKASGVRVKSKADRDRKISFNDHGATFRNEEGSVTYFGDLLPGQTKEIEVTADVSSDVPYGDTKVEISSMVESNETDADRRDNSDILSMIIHRQRPVSNSGGGANINLTADPILKITKTNSATSTVVAGDKVDYQISIINSGGISHYSILKDVLKDENGNIVNEQEWDLDKIYPNEEITVTYTTIFNKKTTSGKYSNFAKITAIGRHPSTNPFYGYFANSNTASSTVTIINLSEDNIGNLSAGGAVRSPYVTLEITKIERSKKLQRSFSTINLPSIAFSKPVSEAIKDFPSIYNFGFAAKLLPSDENQNKQDQLAAAVAALYGAVSTKHLLLLLLFILIFYLTSRVYFKGFKNAFTSFLW